MDPPARIVLVEDESITALDVARQLRRLGYQVVALARRARALPGQLAAHRLPAEPHPGHDAQEAHQRR